MREDNLQVLVDDFRKFILSKGWSIAEEKEIAHGYQLVVTNGVVAAVHVNEQIEAQLIELRVRDSKLLPDSRILSLAEKIRTICRGHGMMRVYDPERYNKLYQETQNLNILLAKTHAQVIASLQKTISSNLAIVDQFGKASLVRDALEQLGCTIKVEQRIHAEDDVAVAAASIIARAECLQRIAKSSQEVGITLPKGASDPTIVTVGREIVAKYGRDKLSKVAKLHFRTTEAVLREA